MKYFDEIKKSMEYIAKKEKSIFIGQAVQVPGTAMFNTLRDINLKKKIELPVAEEMQMGITLGLALEGFIPISIYPRWNFLLLATNQIVNHLDKISEISNGSFKPQAIIRTAVGSVRPLDPQSQHKGDFTDAFKKMCKNIDIYKITEPKDVFKTYKKALKKKRISLIVEVASFFRKIKIKSSYLWIHRICGKNMVEYFHTKKNIQIIATYHNRKKFTKKGVKWKKIDLCIPKQVERITKNVDIIIQAAAATSGSKDIVNNPQKHVTDNAIMNSNIMKSAYENKVKHVIFFVVLLCTHL